MKPFGDQPPTNLTEEEERNLSWDEISKDYWWYEEGKRAEMPPSFEAFYQSHKAEFKNVLDVGGGTGKFAIPMSQDGLDVTLVEPSSGMRKGAKINLEKARQSLKGKVQVIEGESKHLNFPDASFGLLFSKGAMHHNKWEGVRQSFREAKRVLTSGGIFIFQGRSTKDSAVSRADLVPDVGITAKDREGLKKGVIQHYFSKEELEQLTKENGFEIVVEPEEILRDKDNSGKINARWWVVYRKI